MKGKQFRRWAAGILSALLLLSLPPYDGAPIYRAMAESLPAASEAQDSETTQGAAASPLQEDDTSQEEAGNKAEPQSDAQSSPEPTAEIATSENAAPGPMQAPQKSPASYTLSLHLDGGLLEGLSEEGWTQDSETDSWTCTLTETEAGAGALLSLGQPARDGYVFDGWEAGEGATQQEDGSWLITGDVSFTARWLAVATPGTALMNLRASQVVTVTKCQWSYSKSNTNLVLSHADAENIPDQAALMDVMDQLAGKLQLTYTYTGSDGNQQTKTADISVSWQDAKLTAPLQPLIDAVNQKNFNGDTYTITLPDEYLATKIAEEEGFQPEDIDLDYDATSLNSKVQLKVTLGSSKSTIDNKEPYYIQTVNPAHVTFNLFDYWHEDPLLSDQITDNTYGFDIYNSGVNADHALLFLKGSVEGKWNGWTGNTGGVTKNIVQSKLDADGYPLLDLRDKFNASGTWGGNKGSYNPEESLAYLFSPDRVNASSYGKGYSGVKGLLKIADNGNYYYCSHDNFAEFDAEKNRFNVYNTWGVKKGGSSPDGQFFPFNSAEEFLMVNTDGQLTQQNYTSLSDRPNHYLGLTMEVEFQQPVDGMVSVGTSAKPMVFDFSGDDDVWIFIDGVLVADLGGIHDEMKVSIDFSTGAINVERASSPNESTTWSTTLKAQFDAAGDTQTSFDGDTFAGNTIHTLKMFYLERGNTDSNLTLSFNLMEPVDNQLIKLDQNGEPVEGAKFALYEAALDEKTGQPIQNSDGSYRVGNLVAENLTSDENGHCILPEEYDFSQHTYYILRETTIPTGYFSTGDVLLRYDRFEKHPDGTSSGTNLLLVENRWTTGAVSNFVAQVSQAGSLHDNEGNEISLDSGQAGLILAVPLLKSSAGQWLPLYGSNLAGYHAVEYDSSVEGEKEQQRKAVLTAALQQIYSAGQDEHQEEDLGYRRWYLEWNKENQRYQGTLVDLPGDASRYYWASGSMDADMSAAYYFLDLNLLKELFPTTAGMTTEEKLDAVYQAINRTDPEAAIQQLVTNILGQEEKAFGLLDMSEFNRTFASRIYVPNVAPELRVQKLDSDGTPLQGAEFTLYKGTDTTGEVVATGTTDNNGLLLFSQAVGNGLGTAKAVLSQGAYTLAETKPPEGYEPKTETVPVYVTATGRVYADALQEDDGITVRKGLGKLLQTMVRYAAEGSVNVTLRDISASLITADSLKDLPSATPTGTALHLHYGLSNALLEYGTHEVGGVAPNSYFEVDTDYAGIRIEQNYHAHEGDTLYSAVVAKTNLEDTDIRNLFTGSTTVVVRNRKADEKGKFSLQKTVSGQASNPDDTFPFEVTVTEPKEESWDGSSCHYTVTDTETQTTLETGTLTFTKDSNGLYRIDSVQTEGGSSSAYLKNQQDTYQILLKDNQKIEVDNLPFDARVTATEVDNQGYTTQVSVNGGAWTTETKISGNVARPIGNLAFRFNNHKDRLTDLTLKKVVSGTDPQISFPFTITLTDASDSAPLTGRYSYTVTDKDGSETESGTFENGTLTVNLGDGDTLRIEDLPVGAKYLITETPKGFTPTVTVNGKEVPVQDNSISGQLEQETTNVTALVFTNSRTGSITITKRDGLGNLLSGAGFTLYTVDAEGNKSPYGTEQMTALAMNEEVLDGDQNFDKDAMRYTDGTSSYPVHKTRESDYFYYRMLTETERQQYYNGSLPDSDRVEAVVQFTDLPLKNTYAVTETTVPDGYVQNGNFETTMGSIQLGQTPEGQANPVYDILYTVTNHKEMILPTAGQMGITPTLLMGVLLLAAAALLLWTARRKPRRAGPPGPRHPTP